jgi:hypothetical protein
MTDLIQTLKAQHSAVLRLVGTIDDALKQGDAQAVSTQLRQLQTALTAHLALEDRELYPGLIALGVELKDHNLESSARVFQGNMERVTEALVSFLSRHEKPATDLAAFERDWRTIVGVLGARVRSEETSLYPLFEMARDRKARVSRRLVKVE